MSNSISERVARPMPERPVQQAKPPQDTHNADAAAAKNEARATQQAQAAAARQSDKGRHVDRYA